MQAFNKRRPLAAQLSKIQNEITKSSSRSPSPTPTAFKTYFLPVRASVGPFGQVAEETEAERTVGCIDSDGTGQAPVARFPDFGRASCPWLGFVVLARSARRLVTVLEADQGCRIT